MTTFRPFTYTRRFAALSAALLSSSVAFAQTNPGDAPAPSDTAAPTPPSDVPPTPTAAPPATPPAPAATTPPDLGIAPPVAPPATAAELPPMEATPPPPADEMGPNDPLAGWNGEQPFLRSADNQFVLMPGGRLQVDGYFFKRDTDKMPTPSILLRRARLEAFGWVGPYFFYNIGGDFALGAPAAADPVAQSWIATTDDYVGVAPWKNVLMLQVGQFDAPFTLENRTSDKYFDYMERSITVRAFGIPSNKEVGGMLHGILPNKGVFYSLAILNGDGQNFRNVDADFDIMGRAWIAPFALAGVKSAEDITIGGSFWHGTRGNNGLRLGAQQTQGQLTFLDPTFRIPAPAMGGAAIPVEVHQRGILNAAAAELNVPIMHMAGVRSEFVYKHQELGFMDATAPAALTERTPGLLKGWSIYGEAWVWVMGDDTIIGAPGLQLPPRLKKFEPKPPKPGVMIAARYEHLDEKITADTAQGASDSVSGTRKVDSFQLGVNYWYSKRYRATFNYVLNSFGGSATGITSLKSGTLDNSSTEHEFLFRLAIAL